MDNQIKMHYVVQVNHPVHGIRVVGVYSDLDDAVVIAKSIDWSQIVICMEPAA